MFETVGPNDPAARLVAADARKRFPEPAPRARCQPWKPRSSERVEDDWGGTHQPPGEWIGQVTSTSWPAVRDETLAHGPSGDTVTGAVVVTDVMPRRLISVNVLVDRRRHGQRKRRQR